MPTTVDIGALIASNPEIHGGRPCLAGTRVRVQTIAVMAMQGLTSEQILDELPHLDLALIHAALAYYYANKQRIESDVEAEAQLGRELAAEYPYGWTRNTKRS
jgi:uncharacterized protein (DUF433 family)